MAIPAPNSISNTRNPATNTAMTGTITSMLSSSGTLLALALGVEGLRPLPGGEDLRKSA